jgi:hypothetical protein
MSCLAWRSSGVSRVIHSPTRRRVPRLPQERKPTGTRSTLTTLPTESGHVHPEPAPSTGPTVAATSAATAVAAALPEAPAPVEGEAPPRPPPQRRGLRVRKRHGCWSRSSSNRRPDASLSEPSGPYVLAAKPALELRRQRTGPHG